jgi:hypothetical protein
MEVFKDVLITLLKVYLFISVCHSAFFLIVTSAMGSSDMAKGKSRKEVMKNKVSLWNGFIWPKFWFGILKEEKGDSGKSRRPHE